MLKTISSFPIWLRRDLHLQGEWNHARQVVQDLQLHTVCQEARCPNLGECWSHGNVSFMILGDSCTRRCHFCSVTTARPGQVDWEEPERLASAIAQLGLKYVVITSVARDDLQDEGSLLFAASVQAIRRKNPSVQVEVLTPDFHAREELIQNVVESGPDVYSHNIETVPRMSQSVRPQAEYQRSLRVLSIVKKLAKDQIKTKSGLMVGMGETAEEVYQSLVALREVKCDIVTIGQYLRPSFEQREVAEFISPEQFERYRCWGEELGFHFVASGPYVRSSYNAYEALERKNHD